MLKSCRNSATKNGKTLSASDINRQMAEIKKKIQLSEGQRKATFEDCEAERKSNDETIQNLTREITEMLKQLNQLTNSTNSIKSLTKPLEQIIGPIDNKSTDEINELLHLQIIDKSKTIDLVAYKTKAKQNHLAELGEEYHTLLSQKATKEIIKKVDLPLRKSTSNLQNSIHAVQVQLREAVHISQRYQDIKKSLQQDSARFESNIKQIEHEIELQQKDIDKLKQVVGAAHQMRSVARGHLLKEEKMAMTTATTREKQTAEGRRLVNARKHELELLEKRMFQNAKKQQNDDEAACGDEPAPLTDDENPPSTPATANVNTNNDFLKESFETLKQATGATSTAEVLQRFSNQKNTVDRLVMLRKQAESEKKQLQQKLDELSAQLERLKFAESKETERKSSKMEELEVMIEKEKEKSENYAAMTANKRRAMERMSIALRELHVCINPLSVCAENVLDVIANIRKDLKCIFNKMAKEDNEQLKEIIGLGIIEEKWLPSPYSGLVRRTPLPQQQTGVSPGAATVVQQSPQPPPPPAAGSDDEEEVPSRSYLKRQAQLVVDAKSRRKTIRIRT